MKVSLSIEPAFTRTLIGLGGQGETIIRRGCRWISRPVRANSVDHLSSHCDASLLRFFGVIEKPSDELIVGDQAH